FPAFQKYSAAGMEYSEACLVSHQERSDVLEARSFSDTFPNSISEVITMAKTIFSCAVLCIGLLGTQTTFARSGEVRDDGAPQAASTSSVNPVIEWNRTLLVILRTPGAQPATIHSTRSFAIMHAAIFDAVNAIDGTHKPYLVRLGASHFASQK